MMSVHGDFEEEVRKATEAALGRIGAAGAEYRIERPSAGNADLAVPCFQMSKSLRKAPNAIAEEMAAATEPSGMIASVDALNGYLNFTIDSDVLMRRTIDEILESDECYGGHRSNGIKVNVEHTSTNPTGPIHVGRARNPIIGDTLARAMRLRGYDVTTEYYVNDVGKQVVILTWGVNNIPPEDVEKADREKADHALVAFYRAANRMMESDPEVQEEIADLLRRFEAGDSK